MLLSLKVLMTNFSKNLSYCHKPFYRVADTETNCPLVNSLHSHFTDRAFCLINALSSMQVEIDYGFRKKIGLTDNEVVFEGLSRFLTSMSNTKQED